MKLKSLLRHLPAPIQDYLFRKHFYVPDEAYDPEFTVSIANSQEDLEASFKLLHDCYVDIGICEPQPTGLRVTLFSVLPTTTTIVVKAKGQVVGTVSLVMDTNAGIPSDTVYPFENSNFRKKEETRLIEVSALAVSKEYRKRHHGVALMLMKYLYSYARIYMKASHLVCVVHPRAEVFYRALFGFERFGSVKNCSYVKNAPGVLLRMPVPREHFKIMHKLHNRREDKKGVTAFLKMRDPRFLYPKRKSGQVIDPVMTPALLDYFGRHKSNLYNELTREQKASVFNAYCAFFGEKQMAFLRKDLYNKEDRAYRMPTQLNGRIEYDNVVLLVKVLDICEQGCFVAYSNGLPMGASLRLKLKTGGTEIEIEGRPVWRNDKKQSPRLPDGFGVAFEQRDQRVLEMIRRWAAVAS